MFKNPMKKAYQGQRGITGLETAIILIAFVVVASVFAYTVLSAGLFSTQKSKEAVYSGLKETQSTLELRGPVIGYADQRTEDPTGSGDYYNVDTDDSNSINATDKLAVAKVEFTVSNTMGGEPIDLTPPYETANMTAANATAVTAAQGDDYKTVIAYSDKNTSIKDCAWTLDWAGNHDQDRLLDKDEKAIITVWLHYDDSDIADPGGYGLGDPAGDDPFIDKSANLVQTDHEFTLEVKTAKGATLAIERMTPAHLDKVMNLH